MNPADAPLYRFLKNWRFNAEILNEDQMLKAKTETEKNMPKHYGLQADTGDLTRRGISVDLSKDKLTPEEEAILVQEVKQAIGRAVVSRWRKVVFRAKVLLRFKVR